MLSKIRKDINSFSNISELCLWVSSGCFLEHHQDVVYHYTSPEGFLGIIDGSNSPCLWFSRVDSVNDLFEGNYILEMYRQVLTKLYNDNEINQEFFDALKEIELKYTKFINKASCNDIPCFDTTNSEIYICCFSESSDSLPMWNYYTKNGTYEGCNIGVSCGEFEDGNLSEVTFFRVIYDTEDQTETIKTLIKKVNNLLHKQNGGYSFAKDIIESFISTCSLFYKSHYFKHEREVRAVIQVPVDKNEINETYKIKNRLSHGFIIPYIEYFFEKDVICDVTVAPTIKDERVIATIVNLLKNKGFQYVDVNRSKIPVRF